MCLPMTCDLSALNPGGPQEIDRSWNLLYYLEVLTLLRLVCSRAAFLAEIRSIEGSTRCSQNFAHSF